MTKDFIELMKDIKENRIKEGTKIKNVENGDEYVFKSGNFRRDNSYGSHFIRRCNLEAIFEIIKDDVIKFGNYEWYIINEDDEGYTLFMKDSLSDDKILKYFKNSEMVDDDNDVRYSFSEKNNWEDSYIRFVLNSAFLAQFNLDDLCMMNSDYVRLITKEETKTVPQKILECSSEYSYWTMSPFSTSNSYYVWYVTSSGGFYYGYAYRSRGVRPVIKIKRSVLDE